MPEQKLQQSQVPSPKASPKTVPSPEKAQAQQTIPKPDKNAAVPKYVALANG
jgi:hypothetical protein